MKPGTENEVPKAGDNCVVAITPYVLALTPLLECEIEVPETEIGDVPLYAGAYNVSLVPSIVISATLFPEAVKFDISTFVLSHDQSFGIPKFSFKFGISAVVLK